VRARAKGQPRRLAGSASNPECSNIDGLSASPVFRIFREDTGDGLSVSAPGNEKRTAKNLQGRAWQRGLSRDEGAECPFGAAPLVGLAQLADMPVQVERAESENRRV
jgi:hypothetical protein